MTPSSGSMSNTRKARSSKICLTGRQDFGAALQGAALFLLPPPPLTVHPDRPALERAISNYTGAAAFLGSLPKAEWLLGDRGYDADWFRDALKDKGIGPCSPVCKSRGKPIRHNKRRHKRRNSIEIMFGRHKDWPTVGKAVLGTVF